MSKTDPRVDEIVQRIEDEGQGAFVESYDPDDEIMTINMGPVHPATHGVLRLLLELDGETVTHCKPIIGYLHTGMEKECEDQNWRGAVTIVTRMDYLSPFFNEHAYSRAVEKLLDIEVPPRGMYIRMLMSELNRLTSHLVQFGTQGLDMGAMSAMFYGFREREMITRLLRDGHRPPNEPRIHHSRWCLGGPARWLAGTDGQHSRSHAQPTQRVPGLAGREPHLHRTNARGRNHHTPRSATPLV